MSTNVSTAGNASLLDNHSSSSVNSGNVLLGYSASRESGMGGEEEGALFLSSASSSSTSPMSEEKSKRSSMKQAALSKDSIIIFR